MKRLLMGLVALCGLEGLISCSLVPDAVAHGDTTKRLFIVLMDETGSFVPYWKKALHHPQLVVDRMGQEDAFMMIGIDDRAGDPADVRVAMRSLPPNPIEAVGVRTEIIKQIQGQGVRNPAASQTDILGAVATASAVASRHADYRTILIFFSDMDQLPQPPPSMTLPSSAPGFGRTPRRGCSSSRVPTWLSASTSPPPWRSEF